MQQARDLVERFILPWLGKNHPNVDLVVMAGSYGRAMKNGSYQPVASSDVDLVLVYSDLGKDGFRAAMQIAALEDVGSALGGDHAAIMTIDTNIHDLASLHYHDQVVRESTNFAHLHFMLEEGYILLDKLGIGPVLQQNAARFLAEGPTPTPQVLWQGEIDRVERYLDDLRSAETVEGRRFLGTMALFHTRDYVFGLHQYWRCPKAGNQAYRVLAERFPEDGRRITEAFSALIRHGRSQKAEVFLEECIQRGKELLPRLPAADSPPLYPVEEYVPVEEGEAMRDMFLKFMTAHICDALETSRKRGELAYLENLAAAVIYTKTVLETREGAAPVEGGEAVRYLGARLPDLLPATLHALDRGTHDPLREIASGVLSHMGGLHFTRIQNYYPHDVARVYAGGVRSRSSGGASAVGEGFRPEFTP